MLFGWVPFSIGDLLIASILIYFIRSLLILIKTKFANFKNSILKFLGIVSILYSCFYWFWGLNYFRVPLAKSMGFEKKSYSTELLFDVTTKIIRNLNNIHVSINSNDSTAISNPYSQKEMYRMAVSGFDKLANNYPQFTYKIPSIKSSMMSLLQTYNSTAGYLNPLTGEAQVNDMIPKAGYPTTICHEMAHQIGIAAENEANFVGYLAALHHKDSYFKYAAYRMAFSYLIGELRNHNRDLYSKAIAMVNKGILEDFKNSNSFWSKYKNPIEPYIKKGYNSYLKANKQSKGIQSYNYVVDLIISYEELEIQ